MRFPWLCGAVIFLAGAMAVLGAAGGSGKRSPNVVIIFADDLGYGDLGSYGHPSIRTPELDRMASEGLRFTDFYAASPLCTPSRAALLTGRYPVRSGMAGPRGVLFPESKGGLPQSEVTMARALKGAGYATAHLGKWHLGVREGGRPLDHGFDFSLGLPYSNDMDRRADVAAGTEKLKDPPKEGWDVPLMRNGEVVERPADQATLTKRYTEAAVEFIGANRERPFFLYFAHTFPHVPVFASEAFRGKSRRGIYGDTVEEMDWSVGEVLRALKENGVAENTLVIFTSDNGPWLTMGAQGGSAGLLRDGKGGTWEGGMRVPAIFWWPGRIRTAVTSEVAHTMDLFPTVLALAGVAFPKDRMVDGVDLAGLMFEGEELGERAFFYYRGERLSACRLGNYKAHFVTQPGFGPGETVRHEPPLLFDLAVDPGERFDVAAEHPEVLERIAAAVAAHREAMVPGVPQLD